MRAAQKQAVCPLPLRSGGLRRAAGETADPFGVRQFFAKERSVALVLLLRAQAQAGVPSAAEKLAEREVLHSEAEIKEVGEQVLPKITAAAEAYSQARR